MPSGRVVIAGESFCGRPRPSMMSSQSFPGMRSDIRRLIARSKVGPGCDVFHREPHPGHSFCFPIREHFPPLCA